MEWGVCEECVECEEWGGGSVRRVGRVGGGV